MERWGQVEPALLICTRYADSRIPTSAVRDLKREEEEEKKKNNLGEFIESCHVRPSDARRRWRLMDLFSCHSW